MGFLDILLGIVLVAVVAVLLIGVISMARGGNAGAKRSNLMMRWRVGLQFAAVLVIIAILFFRG